MIKEALNAQEREDKINSIVRLLSNLDQGDLNYIMTTVRNEMDNEEALGEVYSEKQRRWACAQDDPKFDEMCADTAISKKKKK